MSEEKSTTGTNSIGRNFRNDTLQVEGRRKMTPQKLQIVLPARLTPEIASQMDLDELYLAGTRYTGACLHGRPRHVAREIVHEGWILLSTTHRWDPNRLPLERWFILVLRNLINVHYRQEDEGSDRETAAQYRNYESGERWVESMAPEEVLVEREDRAERARLAPWHLAQLRGIEAAVAHNPIAVAVLREWTRSGCDLKPSQLADRLGFSVYQVNKAKEVIQYHAKKIRRELRIEGEQS